MPRSTRSQRSIEEGHQIVDIQTVTRSVLVEAAALYGRTIYTENRERTAGFLLQAADLYALAMRLKPQDD